jgi:hypothetical protein
MVEISGVPIDLNLGTFGHNTITGCSRMPVSYCTAANVLFVLGMSSYGTGILTQDNIEDQINAAEQMFEDETNNSFRSKVVTERRDIEAIRFGPLGARQVAYKLRLHNRPIKTLDHNAGDTLKILYSGGYFDLLDPDNHCEEGYAKDYWVNCNDGWVYFISKYPHYRIQGVETTYRWGYAKVPDSVKWAVARRAAELCLLGPSRLTVEIAESGGSNPDQSTISKWHELWDKTVGRYHIIPSK